MKQVRQLLISAGELWQIDDWIETALEMGRSIPEPKGRPLMYA